MIELEEGNFEFALKLNLNRKHVAVTYTVYPGQYKQYNFSKVAFIFIL